MSGACSPSRRRPLPSRPVLPHQRHRAACRAVEEGAEASDDANLDHYLESLERKRFTSALAQTRGNKTAAASLLGVTLRSALLPGKARDGGVRQRLRTFRLD